MANDEEVNLNNSRGYLNELRKRGLVRHNDQLPKLPLLEGRVVMIDAVHFGARQAGELVAARTIFTSDDQSLHELVLDSARAGAQLMGEALINAVRGQLTGDVDKSSVLTSLNAVFERAGILPVEAGDHAA